MSFEVSFERGQGRSLEPRIPGTAPVHKAVTSKQAVSKQEPAKKALSRSPASKAPPLDYWAALSAIERTVRNPPPFDGGIRPEDER